MQRTPAFLHDAAKRSVDEVAGIFFVVKIELPFKTEFEESRGYTHIIGRMCEYYANDPSNRLTQQNVLPAASDVFLLSESIGRARIENAKNAADAYILLQISTWSAILLGLATTVLVSLSSTEFGRGDSTPSRVIRVLAIVLPALGTAAAAITAFYAPREDRPASSTGTQERNAIW